MFNFYAKDFNLSLAFTSNGGVTGYITQFPGSLDLKKPFEGLYVLEESELKMSFVIEWQDKNFVSKTSTCYSGVTFSSENCQKYLLLKWLQTTESIANISPYQEIGHAIMFDKPQQDFELAMDKVLVQISNHIPFDDLF